MDPYLAINQFGICDGCNAERFYSRDQRGYHCNACPLNNNCDLCYNCYDEGYELRNGMVPVPQVTPLRHSLIYPLSPIYKNDPQVTPLRHSLIYPLSPIDKNDPQVIPFRHSLIYPLSPIYKNDPQVTPLNAAPIHRPLLIRCFILLLPLLLFL